MQVIRELDLAHKTKEPLMQKEKRSTDKRLVLLTDTLSQTNQHLARMEEDRSYHVSIAVNHARHSKRSHYASVVKVQKDLVRTEKGRGATLKNASVVSCIFYLM